MSILTQLVKYILRKFMMPTFNFLRSLKSFVIAVFILLISYGTASIANASQFANCSVEGKQLGTDRAQRADAITLAWKNSGENKDDRQLAYVLATAYRETRGTMKPIREGKNCYDEACSRAAIKGFKYDKLVDNNYYYGRGFVQLTGYKNYKNIQDKLKIEGLYGKPDLALEPAIATKILIEGMKNGLFTGKRLDHYFNATTEDWCNARDIINPKSSRKHVTAALGEEFLKCIR